MCSFEINCMDVNDNLVYCYGYYILNLNRIVYNYFWFFILYCLICKWYL